MPMYEREFSVVRSTRRTLAVLVVALLCGVVNFVPSYGRPSFRYTGANPNRHVWNFGFPLSTFIYDSQNARNSLPIGPAAMLLPLYGVAILGLLSLAASFDLREHRKRRSQAMKMIPNHLKSQAASPLTDVCYTVWFENLDADKELDEDWEWCACMVISAKSADEAHKWGDHVSRDYAARSRNRFLKSSVETDLSKCQSLPKLRVGIEESDEYIGW